MGRKGGADGAPTGRCSRRRPCATGARGRGFAKRRRLLWNAASRSRRVPKARDLASRTAVCSQDARHVGRTRTRHVIHPFPSNGVLPFRGPPETWPKAAGRRAQRVAIRGRRAAIVASPSDTKAGARRAKQGDREAEEPLGRGGSAMCRRSVGTDAAESQMPAAAFAALHGSLALGRDHVLGPRNAMEPAASARLAHTMGTQSHVLLVLQMTKMVAGNARRLAVQLTLLRPGPAPLSALDRLRTRASGFLQKAAEREWHASALDNKWHGGDLRSSVARVEPIAPAATLGAACRHVLGHRPSAPRRKRRRRSCTGASPGSHGVPRSDRSAAVHRPCKHLSGT